MKKISVASLGLLLLAFHATTSVNYDVLDIIIP